MRLKLTLQYAGHPYGGWQYQAPKGTPVLPSVQGTLCAALNKLLGGEFFQPKEIIAAGRTDAGVHAWAQVVHADLPENFTNRELTSWVTGLNRFLPFTIRVVAAEVVPLTFHARHSAIARSYCYKLWLGRQLRPDLLHLAGHAPTPVLPNAAKFNVGFMQAAVASLPVGVATDFSSLRDAQCQSKQPICTLTHAQLREVEPDLLGLHIGADHFLHHMVRNLVGTLVEAAFGERDPNLTALLAAKDRKLAGTTFAPSGLYLAGVDYPPLTSR